MDYATKQILDAKFDHVRTTMSGHICATKGRIGILGNDKDGFFIVNAATLEPVPGARALPFNIAVTNALKMS